MDSWNRQMGIPPSKEALSEMKEAFMNLPSYENESIAIEDLENLTQALHLAFSSDQISKYKAYWVKDFGDRIKLEEYLIRAVVVHDMGELARRHATSVDKDKDGLISTDEFKELLKVIADFDKNLEHMSYEDFVAETDTSKGRLVSVEELAGWIGKHTKVIHGDNYRETGIPPSKSDLERMKLIFIGQPSYENGSIGTEDFPALMRQVGMDRLPEQVNVAQQYFKKYFGGRLTVDDYMNHVAVLHNTGEFARSFAVRADTNGDGLISAEEFIHILEIIEHFDHKLGHKTYEDFVAEADTNCDGVVSVDELAAWIGKCTKGKSNNMN